MLPSCQVSLIATLGMSLGFARRRPTTRRACQVPPIAEESRSGGTWYQACADSPR